MLRDEIIRFAKTYSFEEGHSLQDERLALRLFDETARLRLHGLSTCDTRPAAASELFTCDAPGRCVARPAAADELRPRALLSVAALLHDIGYVAGYEQHHKTAFRLISANPIPGLSPHSQALIAHIARYHRGSIPDPAKHAAFAALTPEDQQLVIQLGALLRFADGLDRNHTDAVQDLRCELDDRQLSVTLLPGANDEAERLAGQKKARWFESAFGVSVVLR